LEKEAGGRIEPIQPAAVDLARQSEDVEGRIVAAETEAKAVLAAGRAVTSAGVASGPRHDRLNLVPKADWSRLTASADRVPGGY
jgi:hypothetical protein